MKNAIILTLTLLVSISSCRKREYIPANNFAVYKNYINPDTIPYDISNLKQTIETSLIRSDKVQHLNAFNIIHEKNVALCKVNDSLFRFLHKRYLDCYAEYGINSSGIVNFHHDDLYKKQPTGYYYYCGRLLIIPDVESLLFLKTISENDFKFSDLLLFNINKNKFRSIIKLSDYNGEKTEFDVNLKTYLIRNNTFISVMTPFEMYQKKQTLNLIRKNNKIDYEIVSESESLTPFYYYSFYLDRNGYILMVSSFHKLNNIDLINKEGKISNKVTL